MPASLDGHLIVAISSRALFDFEAENRVFDERDDRDYMRLQLEKTDEPVAPASARSIPDSRCRRKKRSHWLTP